MRRFDWVYIVRLLVVILFLYGAVYFALYGLDLFKTAVLYGFAQVLANQWRGES